MTEGSIRGAAAFLAAPRPRASARSSCCRTRLVNDFEESVFAKLPRLRSAQAASARRRSGMGGDERLRLDDRRRVRGRCARDAALPAFGDVRAVACRDDLTTARLQPRLDGRASRARTPARRAAVEREVRAEEERVELERQLRRLDVRSRWPSSCAMRHGLLDATPSTRSSTAAIASRTTPGRPSNSNDAAAKKQPPGKTPRLTYASHARQIAMRRG